MTDPQSYRWLAPDGSHRVGRKAVIDDRNFIRPVINGLFWLMRVAPTGELTFVRERDLQVWSGKE